MKGTCISSEKRDGAHRPVTGASARRRPGIAKGQSIRKRPKLRETEVAQIAEDIRARMNVMPEKPYTYVQLAEKYGTSEVTLRNKPAVRMAMELARAKVLEGRTESSPSGNAKLNACRRRIEELENQVRNLQRRQQLITIALSARGQSLADLIGLDETDEMSIEFDQDLHDIRLLRVART